MDRRSFLKALAGLGAAVALPLQPTEQQVDEAWNQLVRHPFLFVVNSYGTIIEPEVSEPKIKADIYGDRIETRWITSTASLIDTINAHPELQSHFCSLAASELEDVQNQLERGRLNANERAAAQRVANLIRNPDYDWPKWIRAGGVDAMPGFLALIDDWLEEPVNWNASEWWPRDWSGQGKALSFFQSMDDDLLDALGVVIVEGEHPGSSYYAAELRQPVGDANVTAESLGLPFRFATTGS